MKRLVALGVSAMMAAWGAARGNGTTFALEAPAEVRLPSAAAKAAASLPRSFEAGLWDTQVHVALGPLDLAAIRAKDAKLASEEKVVRIGVVRDLPGAVVLSAAKSGLGEWVALDGGAHVWCLTVSAQDAFGVRLHVAGLSMPDACELRVFDTQDPTQSRGPYTNETLKRREAFWAGTVFASAVTLECYCPAGVAPAEVSFTVDQVVHLYKDPSVIAKEGTCHNDVSCYTSWLTAANGVAGIGSLSYSDYIWCTGCLLNDLDPATYIDYFMTANHCVASQSEANDLEFYWFFQKASCNGAMPNIALVPMTDGGAEYLAGQTRASGNDFSFLRLRTAPPAGVTYEGWSVNTPGASETLACIHHPDGAYKRISFATLAASDANYWEVLFNSGVTEPGSSGSPLFNSSGKFIGQLWGGSSACNYQAGHDEYGRFDVAYPLIANWLSSTPVALGDALDATNLVWTTGGNSPWNGQLVVASDGIDAARSGAITNNSQSWMETSVSGPCAVSFWWKVSSESGYDFLRFSIDGVEQSGALSGTTDWTKKRVLLGEGTHTLRWTYIKDKSVSQGSDCGWVDRVAWTDDLYSCTPEEGGALTSAGYYDGYFYAAGAFGAGEVSAVRGTLSLKVGTLAGRLTAKAATQKGTLNFSSSAWSEQQADGTYRVALRAFSGEALELFVRQNGFWGTLSGGSLGSETFTLSGVRNRFADRTDTDAQTLLTSYLGYYTVALPVVDGLSLGSAQAAPAGSGYLTLTVTSGGSVRIAGQLADGTKVSQSSRLILTDCGPSAACVPFFAPLYYKKGWTGGLLWIETDGKVTTDRDGGWFIRWEKPGAGLDGFSVLLDADGGYYNRMPSLAAHYRFSVMPNDVPYYYLGGVADVQNAAFPDGIGVTSSGLWLSMTLGTKPVLVGGAYDYSAENSAGATLSFMASTGIFKGKFKQYYDYTLNAKLQHKVVSVAYAGVLTPVRGDAFAGGPAGQGYYLVPDNTPQYFLYKLKRSYQAKLEAAP